MYKGRLTCPEIMEAIYDITKGEAVITTEVRTASDVGRSVL